MNIKRLFLALIAFALLLPLAGAGCRRDCCAERSFAPPPDPCCNGLPPRVVPAP